MLPNNSFNTLTPLPRPHKLEILDLSANNFNHQLPEDISSMLPRLRHLNLCLPMWRQWNVFSLLTYHTTTCPESCQEISSLVSIRSSGLSYLTTVSLAHLFQDRVTSLMNLIVDNNMFTGVIDLSNNFLTGTIPRWLGGFELIVLRISNNRLHSEIPHSLFNIPFLMLLDLSGNYLSGTLPLRSHSDSYGHILDLHNNNLTGSIPDTLWKDMALLDLRNNRLSGNIPQFMSTPNISVILLRGNNLTGKLPVGLCGLMDIWTQTYHKSLLVSEWFGLGPIGYSVDFKVQVEFTEKQRYDSYKRGTLDQMFGLDLSSNELSGEIPEELGDLKRVRSMNLSRNSLTGIIPASFQI
ncbi:receptor like protein 45 [Raphanus sativus]|nr:receptor like protein 45 [Raphanus sativus]